MNLTTKRNALLTYLKGLKAQRKLLSGQFGFYGGQTSAASGQEQLQKVFDAAGKWPAMTGSDFQRPDKSFDVSIKEAVDWLIAKWSEGYLVNLSWHADNPAGGSKSLEEPAPPFDMGRILAGGDLHATWRQQLDKVAAGLKRLEDAGVVVIWRPFHEMNGGWFWWHRNEVEAFVKAWREMHDYLTKTKGLTNLLWAYSPNIQWDQWAAAVSKYYPGEAFVDLVGMDYYRAKGTPVNLNARGEYAWMQSTGKPLALFEFGAIPASGSGYDSEAFNWKSQFVDVLAAQFPDVIAWQAWEYVWQMVRPKYTGVREALNDARVITRDELPSWSDTPPDDPPVDPPDDPPTTTNPVPKDWRTSRIADERQRKTIAWAEKYAGDAFGADGHNNMMALAKLAALLDEYAAK